MTPFYMVVATNKDGELQKVGACITTQQQALQTAKDHCIKYNQKTYVFETIAQIELPKPQPIVTMKGD
jgi:hypothetical protein